MDFLFAQEQVNNGGSIAMFLPMILIFSVFYFLIWRPQSNERTSHQKMLKNLAKGDKIITRGGIYGKIIDIQGKDNNQLIIDADNGTKLKINRAFVSGLSNNFKKPNDQNNN